MKRSLVGLTLTALLLAALAAPAAAAPASRAYLIGSGAPLTAAQVDALKAAGAQVKYAYKNFGGAAAVISSANLDKVRALPFVTSLSADTVRQLDAVSASAAALPGAPYWHDAVDLESAGGYTGKGVWVAVLDSGFYPNWRDYFDPATILADKGAAFVSANGNPNENQWEVGSDPHGMAVSAMIVGYYLKDREGEGAFGQGYATGAAGTYWVPGIAPDAKVIPVKVCEPIGCFGSAINAGVDYITSLKKANPSQPIVINESLGGPGLDAVEKAALDAAIKAGVVVVASAGNGGTAGMGFPGAYEPVISVGAGSWRGHWSNWPDNTWWLNDVPEANDDSQIYITGFSARAKAGQYLDVISVGRSTLLPYPCAQYYKDGQVTSSTQVRTCASKASPDNASAAPYQYLHINGTSFSSPLMAGIVALMLEKNPGLSNSDATFGTLSDHTTWKPGSLELALEGAATPIAAPRTVTVINRDGKPLTESWGADAVGKGWVFVDDALDAVP